MKVMNIKIAIKSDKEVLNEVKYTWKKIESGGKVKKQEGLYFENIEAMRKVLTEERLRILKTIRTNHPSSIYALARVLKRDVKNTFNDVQFLTQIGLIELKKTKEGREKSVPSVNYDKILLEIPV